MDNLLTTAELAKYLKLSEIRLKRWRSEGGGPIFVKIGGSVRYREQDVIDFVNGVSSHQLETQSDTAKTVTA